MKITLNYHTYAKLYDAIRCIYEEHSGALEPEQQLAIRELVIDLPVSKSKVDVTLKTSDIGANGWQTILFCLKEYAQYGDKPKMYYYNQLIDMIIQQTTEDIDIHSQLNILENA